MHARARITALFKCAPPSIIGLMITVYQSMCSARTLDSSKFDPREKGGESRVGMQGIKSWVHFQKDEIVSPLFEGLLEPVQSLVLIPQAGVDESNVIRGEIAFARNLFQISENFLCFVFLARNGERVGHFGSYQG